MSKERTIKRTAMKKGEKEKAYYKLWVEFLRRSDRYKDFCQFARAKKKNPSLAYPEGLRDLFPTYIVFREIHDRKWSFEEWWKYRERLIKELKGMSLDTFIARRALNVTEPFNSQSSVTDYAEALRDDFNYCVSQLRFRRKEETIANFIGSLATYLREGTFGGTEHITIRIYPHGKTIDEIMPHIRNHLKKQMRAFGVKFYNEQFKRYLQLQTSHKKLELETYLLAYDLTNDKKKPLEPKELALKLFPNEDSAPESRERKCRLYLEKARNIIKWAERGYFPVTSSNMRKAKSP